MSRQICDRLCWALVGIAAVPLLARCAESEARPAANDRAVDVFVSAENEANIFQGYLGAPMRVNIEKRLPVTELDPRGHTHIPIGIANTLDSLKTFVEAEGNFSPGVGTYGIYFWVYNKASNRLFAPTMRDVPCDHGLTREGYLIPWAQWRAVPVEVRSEICHVQRHRPEGPLHLVGARVTCGNPTDRPVALSLYGALRPLGAAGYDVHRLEVSRAGGALLVGGHAALVSRQDVHGAGVLETDTVGQLATKCMVPPQRSATSRAGDCSGALRFDATLGPGAHKTFSFVCPVLPGRRAVRHRWDGVSQWAQFDLAKPNPPSGGVLQPDPGLDYYRRLSVDALFADAREYWKGLVGRVRLRLPDPRWAQAFAAIAGHAALAMDEGAPDVAVVNYNVFNRDGVYVANILQKAGRADLAAEAIDYFIAHPFNGRAYPEADNPGQILWIMGEHWRFTHDRAWLERIGPAARKIAAMIEYYRTCNGPHWVQMNSLQFGQDVPVHERRKLEPGRCDGYNPAYTEAFDLAGIRAGHMLTGALGKWESGIIDYGALAAEFLDRYDRAYGDDLPAGYGSYCVLWPCRLGHLAKGRAYEQFKDIGPQKPEGWRYFPLARAHQSLLAGNREAGYKTLEYHLEHPQMQRWYAFDEGGQSGSGGWGHLRTTWNGNVAMPHGWAIAELHLLLRDCLAFEESGQLVLFAGMPEDWFKAPDGIEIRDLPTYFGPLSLSWDVTEGGATLQLTGNAAPPRGLVLSLPPAFSVDGEIVARTGRGYLVPGYRKQVQIGFDR